MSKADGRLEEVITQLMRGEISISRLERVLKNANLAALVRRLYLERKLGISLSSIASTILDFEVLYGRNIENPIGAVQIPVGIVGPLLIKGQYANGEFFVPLATTEGALVASVNRGVKAITLSGGARTAIINDHMARAPLLWTPSVDDALRLKSWVEENLEDIRKAAESTTRHGKLKSVFPYIIGNLLWLRFQYHTGDAMGMNMATIASEKACSFILEHYPGEARCLSVSGNMCTDKKPAVLNRLLGRGKYVVAESVIPGDIISKVFKTTAEDIHRLNIAKNLLGSAAAGSPSFNAHAANIIAAIFLATGQDAAQVVESSLVFTWTELRGDSLYISVTLPSLEVGTVGGGTGLPTQREALSIMGVEGGGSPPGANARKFAEIIAATVLAGEINLLAAQAGGELGKAHIKYGRGKAKEEG